MPLIDKRVHSAGFVDPEILCVRPIGLRSFDFDFLAVTISGEAFFFIQGKGAEFHCEKNITCLCAGR